MEIIKLFIITGSKRERHSLLVCYPEKAFNKTGALGHIRASSSQETTQSI